MVMTGKKRHNTCASYFKHPGLNNLLKPVVFFAALAFLVVLTDANPLQYVDKQKITLIATDDHDSIFLRQLDLLKSDTSGLIERDIAVETRVDRLAVHPFTLIIYGKDGAEVLRAYELKAPQSIFAKIDSLPPRKHQISQKPQVYPEFAANK